MEWSVILFFVFMACVAYIHWKFGDHDKVYVFQGLNDDDFFNVITKPKPAIKRKKPVKRGKQVKKKVYKSEERCRDILENIFRCKFPSVRPSFLNNPVTGKNLELDCYNERMKLALEYDGAQHAKYTPRFHKNDKWKFVYQVRKDDWKNLKCKENGVTLIRVPHYIQYDKLEEYIRKKLVKLGLV